MYVPKFLSTQEALALRLVLGKYLSSDRVEELVEETDLAAKQRFQEKMQITYILLEIENMFKSGALQAAAQRQKLWAQPQTQDETALLLFNLWPPGDWKKNQLPMIENFPEKLLDEEIRWNKWEDQ